MIEKNLFDTIYHEHLSYHSLGPLVRFFGKHGMKIVSAKNISSKGGSIRIIVKRIAEAGDHISNEVARTISFERERGLDRRLTFVAWKKRIDEAKEQNLELLKKIKSQKQMIAGYGASVTVTNVIYQFNIAEFLDFLVDDNVDRQGMLSPGYHLPVLSPEELLRKKPEYTLILAWNYAVQIIKKNSVYSDMGGHFIVPLPLPVRTI